MFQVAFMTGICLVSGSTNRFGSWMGQGNAIIICSIKGVLVLGEMFCDRRYQVTLTIGHSVLQAPGNGFPWEVLTSRVAMDTSSLLIAFGHPLTFKAPAPKIINRDEFKTTCFVLYTKSKKSVYSLPLWMKHHRVAVLPFAAQLLSCIHDSSVSTNTKKLGHELASLKNCPIAKYSKKTRLSLQNVPLNLWQTHSVPLICDSHRVNQGKGLRGLKHLTLARLEPVSLELESGVLTITPPCLPKQ